MHTTETKIDLQKKTEFEFTMLVTAAKRNWEVLEKYNLDLGKALESHQGTQLEYNSEFKK